jgi:hypothetical protein
LTHVDDLFFSPDGSMLLTLKEDSGYELFRASDVSRMSLPPGVIFARFTAGSALELTLSNGGILVWHMPDAISEEVGFRKEKLTPRDLH